MKTPTDKFWTVLLLVVCLAFATNVTMTARHASHAARIRNEIVENQRSILTNQSFIIEVLTNKVNQK